MIPFINEIVISTFVTGACIGVSTLLKQFLPKPPDFPSDQSNASCDRCQSHIDYCLCKFEVDKI